MNGLLKHYLVFLTQLKGQWWLIEKNFKWLRGLKISMIPLRSGGIWFKNIILVNIHKSYINQVTRLKSLAYSKGGSWLLHIWILMAHRSTLEESWDPVAISSSSCCRLRNVQLTPLHVPDYCRHILTSPTCGLLLTLTLGLEVDPGFLCRGLVLKER